jgi:predicted RND superfamily exporter protein
VLQRLTRWQEAHALEIVLIVLFLTVAFIPGMAQLETIVSLENMLPADEGAVQTFNELRDRGMGKDSVAVVIEAGRSGDGLDDLRSERARELFRDLGAELRRDPGVEAVMTPLQEDRLYADDYQKALVAVYGYQGDSGTKMADLFTEIQLSIADVPVPEGVSTSLSGVPVIQDRLAEMVARDKNVTTVISLVLVFMLTLALFRGSITMAIMPLVMVVLSVIWLYGTMGYLGLPLSALAGGVASLVIGIGIDYSIHIMNTYRYEREGASVQEAMIEAVSETGTALAATSVTTISAFLAFLLGDMPEMHRFGLTMAIGIFYALVFAILLLPPVFVLEERLANMVHERLDARVG